MDIVVMMYFVLGSSILAVDYEMKKPLYYFKITKRIQRFLIMRGFSMSRRIQIPLPRLTIIRIPVLLLFWVFFLTLKKE